METPIEWFFLGCSIFGGCFFVIRLISQLLGIVGLSDSDLPSHHDAIHTDHDISDSFDSFKYFTIQNLTAFLMMFGLVGLGMIRSHIHIMLTLIAACIAGGFTVYLMVKIFTTMSKLESSGTLDMNNAIGQEGTVYLTIPKHGSGQVQIAIQDRMQVLDAVSEHNEIIETGERIFVVRVIDDYILSVDKCSTAHCLT